MRRSMYSSTINTGRTDQNLYLITQNEVEKRKKHNNKIIDVFKRREYDAQQKKAVNQHKFMGIFIMFN